MVHVICCPFQQVTFVVYTTSISLNRGWDKRMTVTPPGEMASFFNVNFSWLLTAYLVLYYYFGC